jgi:hypothetical protein
VYLPSVTYIGKCFLAILKLADVGSFPSVDSEVDFQGRFLVELFTTASLRADKGPFVCVDAIVSAEVRPANKFLIRRCQKSCKMAESIPHLAATFPLAGEVTHLA